MRVLRTEMYFSRDQITDLYLRNRGNARNPGLSFAWFQAGGSTEGLHEELLADRIFYREEGTAAAFLDHVLRGFDKRLPFLFIADPLRLANRGIIEQVMNDAIIIENSPPEAVPLRSLIARAPGVAIGTFIGIAAARNYSPLLMFLTVPGGILVCSSAIGISKALEKGLNQRIEKLIKPKR
jgi:hypothetical protein